jgi:hypothetical protein
MYVMCLCITYIILLNLGDQNNFDTIKYINLTHNIKYFGLSNTSSTPRTCLDTFTKNNI